MADLVFSVLNNIVEAQSTGGLALPIVDLVALLALIDDPMKFNVMPVVPLLYNNKGVMESNAFLHDSLAPLTYALASGGSMSKLVVDMNIRVVNTATTPIVHTIATMLVIPVDPRNSMHQILLFLL